MQRSTRTFTAQSPRSTCTPSSLTSSIETDWEPNLFIVILHPKGPQPYSSPQDPLYGLHSTIIPENTIKSKKPKNTIKIYVYQRVPIRLDNSNTPSTITYQITKRHCQLGGGGMNQPSNSQSLIEIIQVSHGSTTFYPSLNGASLVVQPPRHQPYGALQQPIKILLKITIHSKHLLTPWIYSWLKQLFKEIQQIR